MKTIRDLTKKYPIRAGIILVFFGAIAGLITTLLPNIHPELQKALYTASVGLIFGGFIGGLLKILLDDYTENQKIREKAAETVRQEHEKEALLERQKRTDAAVFVRRVLNDLKSVYDRVARVRIVIPAHQSAKTYGSEMRDLIDAHVVLKKNVVRALDGTTDGLSPHARTEIICYVKQMEKYLNDLSDEFKDEYKTLSNQQRIYEEQVSARLKTQGEHAEVGNVFIGEEVWPTIKNLERLCKLIKEPNSEEYQKGFERPLDCASALLREELRRIISGEPPSKEAPQSMSNADCQCVDEHT